MTYSKPTILFLLAVAIGLVCPTLIRAESRPAGSRTLSDAVEQLVSSRTLSTSSSGIQPAELSQIVVNSTVLFDDQRPTRVSWKVVSNNVQQDLSFIVADATSSYKGHAENFRRWVVFLPGYGVLMLDEFKTSASTCRLVFSDRTKFLLDENILDAHFGSISDKGEFKSPYAGGTLQVGVSNWQSIEPVSVSQAQLSDQKIWQLEVKSTLEKDYDQPQYITTWIRNAPHEKSFNYQNVSALWKTSKVTFRVKTESLKVNINFTVDFAKMTVRRAN